MNKEPILGLHPLNDCVLVELKQSTKNFSTKEGKYDSRTEGIVLEVPPNNDHRVKLEVKVGFDIDSLVGKRIHFDDFKEGARIKRGTSVYSFIKIEDIRGYEDE